MPTELPSLPTQVDLELALAYYAVLVEVARCCQTITYGSLVERAKMAFPENATVQNAIPVSAGRRLDFVRAFTNQRQLPDLSSLVVNRSTGECGVGFTRSFNPDEARAQVFAYDWRSVETEFTGEVAAAKERRKPKKEITEDEASMLMYKYFSENKAALDPAIRNFRRQIINLIMSGAEPKNAFAQVLTQ
jgi:hypothetical protein